MRSSATLMNDSCVLRAFSFEAAMPAALFYSLFRDVFGQGRLKRLGGKSNQNWLGTRLHISTNFGLLFFHFSRVF